MSPWRYTERESRYSQSKVRDVSIYELQHRGGSARWRTCDAFLQALVEPTQADLVQQTGIEALKGFHGSQTCQDYVDVLSGAL